MKEGELVSIGMKELEPGLYELANLGEPIPGGSDPFIIGSISNEYSNWDIPLQERFAVHQGYRLNDGLKRSLRYLGPPEGSPIVLRRRGLNTGDLVRVIWQGRVTLVDGDYPAATHTGTNMPIGVQYMDIQAPGAFIMPPPNAGALIDFVFNGRI